MSLLQIERLSKRFGGYAALDDISFDVHDGEILGLIGPNGSGKTTLLECLAGLLPASGGLMTLAGRQLDGARRRAALFYLPDGATPYGELFVAEVVHLFGDLYGLGPERLARVVRDLELTTVLRHRVSTLSKGYGRRLLLALGVLAPQPLLLLDEPFDGLDLHQIERVMALLRGLRDNGRTLLLSIHQLTDAERICDRFLLVAAGRLVGQGTIAELRVQAGLADGGLEDAFRALTRPTAATPLQPVGA